jgi:hypothetical protein
MKDWMNHSSQGLIFFFNVTQTQLVDRLFQYEISKFLLKKQVNKWNF